jgi:hypothetical protein
MRISVEITLDSRVWKIKRNLIPGFNFIQIFLLQIGKNKMLKKVFAFSMKHSEVRSASLLLFVNLSKKPMYFFASSSLPSCGLYTNQSPFHCLDPHLCIFLGFFAKRTGQNVIAQKRTKYDRCGLLH